MRSIIYWRKASTSTGQVDVVLANDTSGRLVDYRIPHSSPTKGTSTTLNTSGSQYYRALTISSFGTRGRTIGGITDGGRIFVYYDANRSGSDIKGGNTGLNLPAFGQSTGRRQGLDAATTRVYFSLAPGWGAPPFAPRGRP